MLSKTRPWIDPTAVPDSMDTNTRLTAVTRSRRSHGTKSIPININNIPTAQAIAFAHNHRPERSTYLRRITVCAKPRIGPVISPSTIASVYWPIADGSAGGLEFGDRANVSNDIIVLGSMPIDQATPSCPKCSCHKGY